MDVRVDVRVSIIEKGATEANAETSATNTESTAETAENSTTTSETKSAGKSAYTNAKSLWISQLFCRIIVIMVHVVRQGSRIHFRSGIYVHIFAFFNGIFLVVVVVEATSISSVKTSVGSVTAIKSPVRTISSVSAISAVANWIAFHFVRHHRESVLVVQVQFFHLVFMGPCHKHHGQSAQSGQNITNLIL